MGRCFWNRFDPSFAASVHNTIFDEALGDIASADAISAMKRQSLWMDANIATYDPRDHFDNGYIEQGWQKVNERLANVQEHPVRLGEFWRSSPQHRRLLRPFVVCAFRAHSERRFRKAL